MGMSGRGRGRGGGRGAYYKELYGNKRGFGSANRVFNQGTNAHSSAGNLLDRDNAAPRTWSQLGQDLRNIDGQQYESSAKAFFSSSAVYIQQTTEESPNRDSGQYKRLLGQYRHISPDFILHFDRIQADPYAQPSHIRVRMTCDSAGISLLYREHHRRTAVCDFISRVAGDFIQAKHFDRNIGSANGGWSAPKGGAFSICMPGQEILPRSSCLVNDHGEIELRLTISMPASGRTILGQQAYQMLAENLVELVQKTLIFHNLDLQKLGQFVETALEQERLREEVISEHYGLMAFVANGSVLPRASGASQTPMCGDGVVSFQSPPELEVTVKSNDGASITGMGIPRGVTVLTGGGFHGKSTLLQALELGIYNHILGDGREKVVTCRSAVKIRAEDGRSVTNVDISPFIEDLPGGKDTSAFSTEDASGSTSMAASIQEALEAGCKLLLIDEDCSATNLLVRDHRMQALIKNEPITPLVSKVRSLYEQHGVSTVIVVGGLGDFLTVADTVIALDLYRPRCITTEAKELVRRNPAPIPQDPQYGDLQKRSFRLDLEGFKSPFASRKDFIRLTSTGARDAVSDPSRAESGIDLSGLDQIVEPGQARLIASVIDLTAAKLGQKALSVADILQQLRILAVELDVSVFTNFASSFLPGDLVAIRPHELLAAISRIRGQALQVEKV